jgi:hypothetical protein
MKGAPSCRHAATDESKQGEKTMSLLRWDDTDRFEPGFKVGSEGDNGEHRRDETGWPYSVYRRNIAIGGCDIVICHGIQCRVDAIEICDRLQGLA